MPRIALSAMVIASLFAATPLVARGRANPHVDPALVRSGCSACHAGHGNAKSPMLLAAQKATCLRCHGTVDGATDDLAADAKPALIGSTSAKVSGHRIDDNAYASADPNGIICTSCHSPHRSSIESRPEKPSGTRFRAPNDPSVYENDLCLRCHGRLGRTDVASLVNPMNRSYHPLNAPSPDRSRTLDPLLSGKMINCTDCHGNSDATGPRGPHGSDIPPLLKKAYRRSDGGAESTAAFDLCYSCHDRDILLRGGAFPQHTQHVAEAKISCATCHDPHGSIASRALIRFADPARSGITPSVKTGRLAFVSDAPGSGACYLNCHGVEHGPEIYGGGIGPQQLRSRAPAVTPVPGAVALPEMPRRGPPEPPRPRNRDLRP